VSRRTSRLQVVVIVTVAAVYGAVVGHAAVAAASAGAKGGELPTPVQVRSEPDGITLEDPAFAALPGAHADFGRLGGAVYQVEVPDNWNGRLVLFMHGYGELGPEASATAPDFRRYLIGHGFAASRRRDGRGLGLLRAHVRAPAADVHHGVLDGGCCDPHRRRAVPGPL